jgi:hypothetical protein
MISDLLRRLVEGLFAPNLSARRILGENYGIDAVILFAALAYTVQAMLGILIPGAPRPEDGGIGIVEHLLQFLSQLFLLGVVAAAIFGAGRLFGGTGTMQQSLVIVAWHSLVTTLLFPLTVLGVAQLPEAGPEGAAQGGDIPLGAAVMLLVVGGLYIWLLAAYTRELHGFTSTWGVLGMMMAVMFVFSGLIVNFAPGG